MSGLSTKESEDNEDIWRHKCMKCIRCFENTNCGVCWPCKLGKTCDKRRCFKARKMYEDSLRKMADMNLAAIKAKTAAREAASASGPITLHPTSSSPYVSSSVTYMPEPEKKKRGRKKKSELAALAQQGSRHRIDEMDYVPHRPTRQQSADLRRKRTTTSDFQSAVDSEPRQCLQPDCIYEARAESKYCSDECGRILAMMRLTEVLPQRVKEYFEPGPGGEPSLEETLKAKQEKVQADMIRLNDAEKSMVGFLDKLHAFVEKQIPLPPLAITEKFDDNLYEACVVCGQHDIPLRKYAKHIELCWSRCEKATTFAASEKSNETIYCERFDARTGAYCKRLKSLCPEHRKPGIEHVLKVCGYPKRWETGVGGKTSNSLSELIEMDDPFGDEGCRTKKDLCHKHHKWVPSLRGSIELEMSSLYQQMLDLMQQGHKLQRRLQWSTNALSIMVNKGAVITDERLFQQHLKELQEERGNTSVSTSSSSDAQKSEDADDPGSSSTQDSHSTQASEEMLVAAGILADMALRRPDEQQQQRAEQARREAEAERRRRQQQQQRVDEMDDSDDSVDYSQPGPSSAIRRGRGDGSPTTPTPSTITTTSTSSTTNITAASDSTVSTTVSTTITTSTSISTSTTTNEGQEHSEESEEDRLATPRAAALSPISVSVLPPSSSEAVAVVATEVSSSATNPPPAADLTPQPQSQPLKSSPGFSISRFLE